MVGRQELMMARAHSATAQNEFSPLESGARVRIGRVGWSDGGVHV